MHQKLTEFKAKMQKQYTDAYEKSSVKTIDRTSLDYAAGCIETCNKCTDITVPVQPDLESEFFGQIIDIFEDFLDEKKVQIINQDRDEAIADGEDPESLAIIYGEDYDIIRNRLAAMMQQWSITQTKGD